MPIMSSSTVGKSARCRFADDFSRIGAPVFNLAKCLNDSMNQGEMIDYTSAVESSGENPEHHNSIIHTPCRTLNRNSMWDSGFGSPTTNFSSTKKPTTIRNRMTESDSLFFSPISYSSEQEELKKMLEKSFTNSNGNLNDFDFAPLPATPVCRNGSSSRRLLNSSNCNIQHSMKKMNINPSPYSHHDDAPDSIHTSRFYIKSHKKSKVLFSNVNSPRANVNPFAVDLKNSHLRSGTKRCREQVDSSPVNLDSSLDESNQQPQKKLALRSMNTSRFKKEFHMMSRIGDGHFGSVFQCLNRLDGCTYAIKRSNKQVVGSVFENNAINEVYAHAVLGKHPHIIGYYSSWVEQDRLFIQNEYCNGGSLSNVLRQDRLNNCVFSERQLSALLYQVSDGLSYVHSHGLVHLDLKPDNILVCYRKKQTSSFASSSPASVTATSPSSLMLFSSSLSPLPKKSDFGMVTSITSSSVNEGDCRYLPKEILQENTTDVQKADIFSLSLTVYEAGSNVEMPLNGPTWQEYRLFGLPNLRHVSEDFNDILRVS
ncbi:hypothetical protein HELRODRAFT_106737 [Helobdella robusta]|uniref:Protein kinase domain-containing protein n=1 Tax=Helobdella robusta TaxID=6412 RepID=T1EE44_HELRO|nr:hypothetical protein HELRODRAFT_106737 [Helobdella robusta]ESO02569.1 hypothetical protein HELRODRAFT_106737 [Helobdella robusta]